MEESDFDALAVNALPGMRRETLNGREYIVRNMVLIVPGVLPGSQGPFLYKPQVVSRDVDTWNGMPLVGYHPRSGGKHSSARDPKVLNEQGLGWVFNATYDKQLMAEGWFDVANVEKFDKTLKDDAKLMPRLIGSQPIELSTGLYTIRNTRKGKHSDGRDYIGEIENMKPDHVAILPDQVGACSIKDGCGVVVNECECAECKEKRKKKSVPDPVPVPTKETDVDNKTTLVSWLTANCDCWKGQEKALENFDEPQLKKLKADAETTQTLLANAATPKQLTMEEWTKIAPPEVLEVFNAAKVVVVDRKSPIVEELVANCDDADKDAMKAVYNKMSIEDLTVLRDKLPKAVMKRAPIFVGDGAGTANSKSVKKPNSGPLKRPMPFKDQAIVAKFGSVPSKS